MKRSLLTTISRFIYLHYLLILPLIIISLLGLWYYLCLPDPLFDSPISLVLTDQNAALLGAKIAADEQWRFPYNPSVSQKFIHCIVTYEDKRYFDHFGVDPLALARAMYQNVSQGEIISGASTLTMQVIRLSRPEEPRSIAEKLLEMIFATRLELSRTKDEILSLYASNAPFGGNIVGLDAASWRYFGISQDKLSWGQAATLAVLPNNPSLVHPGRNREILLEKRNQLIHRLKDNGIIDELTAQAAVAEPLPDDPYPLPSFAPHLMEHIRQTLNQEQRNSIIQTTLNRDIQTQVNTILQNHYLQTLKGNGIHNAAALVVEVETGEVIAYSGNILLNLQESGRQVDIIQSPRSTGSILKPILYAAMLSKGELLPDTLVADIPTNIAGYAPENFDRSYSGALPASQALARSLNIPAVRMLRQYGLEVFHHQLKHFGMTTLNQPPDHYGLSLILGGAEGTLWDITQIYLNMARTLLRYNREAHYSMSDWGEPIFLFDNTDETREGLNIEDPTHLNAASIWFTFEAMVEVVRPGEELSWRRFSSSRKIAWKTGTSFGNRDAWAIGITREYVIGVWVGNADGEGRPDLIGIKAAAPILFDIVNRIASQNWFEQPYSDMVMVPICTKSGYRASEACQSTIDQWIPKSGLRTESCPYHQWIHLDPTSHYQVNADCESISNIKTTSWFVLPPSQEIFYKTRNTDYREIPPFRQDCLATIASANTSNNMELIYPASSTNLYIPIELDGSQGRAVFKAAHRDPQAIIYWHIDDEYIGNTKGLHEIEINPTSGEHTLTMVDHQGEEISLLFTILNPSQ